MAQLDLAALRVFLAIAETGSITAAADRVHRSAAAVSMQAGKLERAIGRTLLRRLPRGVELTAEGEQLLAYARRIVRLEQEAVSSLVRPALRGTVRIGTPDDYAHCFLPDLLARFNEHEPDIAIEVHCQASQILLQELRDGNLDLAVITQTGDEPEGEVLHHEPVVFAGTQGFRHFHDLPVSLALWLPGCPIRTMALKALDNAGIAYRIAYTSPSNAALQAAVLAGLAVGAMARSTLTPDMKVLEQADGFPSAGHIRLALHRRPDFSSAVVEELARHIVSWFRDLSPAIGSSRWRLTAHG